MKIKKVIFVALGCICLALGTIGICLPIIPTTPFYLATLFFFANSSDRLHKWFTESKLYEKHLASYVKGEGMLKQTKIGIMITVTALMSFGAFMMARKGIWIPCIILAAVWIAHIYYFLFRVQTITAKK